MGSSVAKGGGGLKSPIGLKSIKNTTFLMLLRPIVAPKMKTALLWGWRAEVEKDLLLIGPEKWSFYFCTSPKVAREN